MHNNINKIFFIIITLFANSVTLYSSDKAFEEDKQRRLLEEQQRHPPPEQPVGPAPQTATVTTFTTAHQQPQPQYIVIYHAFNEFLTKRAMEDYCKQYLQSQPSTSAMGRLLLKEWSIESKLEELQRAGFTHIQISPIQICTRRYVASACNRDSKIRWDYTDEEGARKTFDRPCSGTYPCHAHDPWYFAYQPFGYEIGNKYGTEGDLRYLISKAREMDIGIIVDVALGWFAPLNQGNRWQWVEALAKDDVPDNAQQIPPLENLHNYNRLLEGYSGRLQFSSPIGLNQIILPYRYHFTDSKSTPHHWNIGRHTGDYGSWLSGCLPAVNLESVIVKQMQKDFLTKLLGMGVAGFRFDAIKHFPPNTVKEYVDFIHERNQTAIIYGEGTWGDREVGMYGRMDAEGMHTIDFILARQLRRIFCYGGNFSELIPLQTNRLGNSVTFAENHDTFAGSIPLIDCSNHNICYLSHSDSFDWHIQHSNSQGYCRCECHSTKNQNVDDLRLANAFLIARAEGMPLILNKNIFKKTIQETRVIYEMDPNLEKVIKFRKKMAALSAFQENIIYLNNYPGLLFLSRKNSDNLGEFIIINKTATEQHVAISNLPGELRAMLPESMSGKQASRKQKKHPEEAAIIIPPQNVYLLKK